MDKDELFRELLQLLMVFDSFCKKHQLRYYLYGGSLLGAVRHKGFIPWDDDIDLCMLGEDYDRLITLRNEFQYPFVLQLSNTDYGYNKTFAKLRNSNTTEIPWKDAIYHYNQGIFIDIFPLDNVPESSFFFKFQVVLLKLLEGLLHFQSRFYGKVGPLGLKGFKKVCYYLVAAFFKFKIITPEGVFRSQRKISSWYNEITTNRVAPICFSYDSHKLVCPRECFSESINSQFETMLVPIPCGYDTILTLMYGDYMTPKKTASEHGSVIFNAEIPYYEYMKIYEQDLFELWKRFHS